MLGHAQPRQKEGEGGKRFVFKFNHGRLPILVCHNHVDIRLSVVRDTFYSQESLPFLCFVTVLLLIHHNSDISAPGRVKIEDKVVSDMLCLIDRLVH